MATGRAPTRGKEDAGCCSKASGMLPSEEPFFPSQLPGDQVREVRGSGGTTHPLILPKFPVSKEGQKRGSEMGTTALGGPSSGRGVGSLRASCSPSSEWRVPQGSSPRSPGLPSGCLVQRAHQF